MGKKKNIPDYLKKSLRGTTVGGSLGVDDTEYVTVPKGTLNISKGKTTIEGGVAKPISKFDNESGGVSLTGSKSGKNKSVTFSLSKTFNTGGEARGTGAAIRGKGFK